MHAQASMYWAITTITTVGYGDILPSNRAERVWCIFSMTIGAAVFGLIIGNISDFVTHQNAADKLMDEKMANVTAYLDGRHVPQELCIRIRKYLRNVWSEKTAFNEDAILEDLSSNLKVLQTHVCRTCRACLYVAYATRLSLCGSCCVLRFLLCVAVLWREI